MTISDLRLSPLIFIFGFLNIAYSLETLFAMRSQISSCLFIFLLFVLMHSPKMYLRVSAWMPQFIFVSFLTLRNAVLVQYAFVLNFNTFKYRDGFSNSGLYTHVFPILFPKNSCMPCPCEANDFHLLVSAFLNLFRIASISSVSHGHCRSMYAAYFFVTSSC